MLADSEKYTRTLPDSEGLVCLICDLQQSSGYSNRYCYKCDQVFFSEASACSTPMSKHSLPKTPKDDESFESSKRELNVEVSRPASEAQFHPVQYVQGFESTQRSPGLHRYEVTGQNPNAGFLPFAYNHGLTMPGVDRFEPGAGPEGTAVNVYLHSTRDLSLNPAPNPTIIFGTRRCQSQLYPAGKRDGSFCYTLTFWIPAIAASVSPVLVPMYLSMNDATSNTTSPAPFGNFVYHAHVQSHEAMQGHAAPSMRRVSSASAVHEASDRRGGFQAPSWPSVDRFSRPYYPEQAFLAPVAPQQQQQQFLTDHSQPVLGSNYSGILPSSQDPQYEQGTQREQIYWESSSSQSPSFPTVFSSEYSPVWHLSGQNFAPIPAYFGPMRTSAQLHSLTETAGIARAAPLKRTASHSRLRADPASPHFNPYSVPRATLDIQGDLNDMLKNWTQEERQNFRRIVTFDRRQAGSVISTNFRAVSLDEWDPESISVSCIWWAEKREAFITSVDLIGLLESTVGLRFTLQEKNRIRRNLEGFKPYTIGKSKPDKEPFSDEVEAFFKVIMGLDEPKPRSIEKDVKVFPWKSLAAAMKKVVDKYSASYASTAGALHPFASLPRSDDEESPRRPSASQSDAASSSARSADRDVSAEVSFHSVVSSAEQPSGSFMHDSQPDIARGYFNSWQSSESESSSYGRTTSSGHSNQLFASSADAGHHLLATSTSTWNIPLHHYISPNEQFYPYVHPHTTGN